MITIYGELYSSKNSKRIVYNKSTKKPFLIKSGKSLASEKNLQLQLQANKGKWLKMLGGNPSYPVAVMFKIYRRTHGRFDYCNVTMLLHDVMVKCGYLPDDSAKYFIPVFAPYEVDKTSPRVEISVIDLQIYKNCLESDFAEIKKPERVGL